jgi:putative nucleotidyltransferase with HDIG domain
MVTLFWLQKVKKRSQVISAGLSVGIINLLIYTGVELTRESFFVSEMFKENAFAAFANGVLCGFLTLLLIPFFEKAFGYVSPFRLMELADLDSDLMRELYLKAPGTYHHSLAVANLAEIAANEIGADALLLRVGAYYHDIGKMFKPKFFVENIGQTVENPHNKISPYASSKVLKSHVTLGLELGEKYGLPRKILDLIPQHHGTTVMDYFFDKAKKSTESGSISDKYFAYPGPRPQTKEASILMIVDSVEAASRVLVDNSEETVQKMIEKLINHKLEQKQLDEAPLTVSELRRITYALSKALSTSTHKRIDYPERSGGISSQFSAASKDKPEEADAPAEVTPNGETVPAAASGASTDNPRPADQPAPDKPAPADAPPKQKE